MHRLPRYSLLLALTAAAASAADWKQIVDERLPLYGHRNWIVVADSAYPAQSRPGIETVVADASQQQVLQYVLQALSRSKHVRPDIFLDKELKFVTEDNAPGVDAYRESLLALLADHKPQSLLHEQVIAKLDQAGETFRVLILKTNLTIPYTTVFLQLNCAYWSDEAEHSLRRAMSAKP